MSCCTSPLRFWLFLSFLAFGCSQDPYLDVADKLFEDLDWHVQQLLQSHSIKPILRDELPRQEFKIHQFKQLPLHCDVRGIKHWKLLDSGERKYFLADTSNYVYVWLQTTHLSPFLRTTAIFSRHYDQVLGAVIYQKEASVKFAVLTPRALFIYNVQASNVSPLGQYGMDDPGAKLVEVQGTLVVVSPKMSPHFKAQDKDYMAIGYPNVLTATGFAHSIGDSYILVANQTTCSIFDTRAFPRAKQWLNLEYDQEKILAFNSETESVVIIASPRVQKLYTWAMGSLHHRTDLKLPTPRGYHIFQFPQWQGETVILTIQPHGELLWNLWRLDRISRKNVDFLQESIAGPVDPLSFVHNGMTHLILDSPGFGSRVYEIRGEIENLPSPRTKYEMGVEKNIGSAQSFLDETDGKISGISNLVASAVNRNDLPTASQIYDSIQTESAEVFSMTASVQAPYNLGDYKDGVEEDILSRGQDLENRFSHISAKLNGMFNRTTVSHVNRLVLHGNYITRDLTTTNVVIPKYKIPDFFYPKDDDTKPWINVLGHLIIKQEFKNNDLNDYIPGTEFVLDSGIQEIVTDEYVLFQDVAIENLIVDGTVDLCNSLDSLEDQFRVKDIYYMDGRSYEQIKFGDLVTVNNMTIIDVGLFDQAMTKSTSQFFVGPKHLRGNVLTNTIFADNFKFNLVSKRASSHIKGEKTFTNDVQMSSLDVESRIDNVDLRNIWRNDAPNSVTAEKTCHSISGPYVEVRENLNKVDLRNVLRLSGRDYIDHDFAFDNGIAIQRGLQISNGMLNGLNISQLVQGEINVGGDVTFPSEVNILGSLLMDMPELNELHNEAIYNNFPETNITGRVSFNANLDVQKLQSFHDFVTRDYVTLDGDQLISGTKTFVKPIYFNSIESTGLVDNVDLSALMEDMLKSDIEITGNVTMDNIHVFNTMSASGFICGIWLPDDIVLREIPSQQDLLKKTFLNGLSVYNLTFTEREDRLDANSVDEVDVSDFNANRVTLTTNQDLRNSYQACNVRALYLNATAEPHLPGLVKCHSDYVINAPKIFSKVVASHLYGIVPDVSSFATKSSPQTFVAPVKFTNLEVAGSINSGGLVSGVNLQEVEEFSVKKNGPQTIQGPVTIYGNVFVDGDIQSELINGTDLFPSTVFLKVGDQQLHGNFVVKNVEAKSDVDVIGYTGDWNLDRAPQVLFLKSRNNSAQTNLFVSRLGLVEKNIDIKDNFHFKYPFVMQGEEEYIGGTKIMNKLVVAEKMAGVIALNGIDWPLEDIAHINDPLVFDEQVDFETLKVDENLRSLKSTSVTGFINTVDLMDFSDSVVYINKNAWIKNKKFLKDDAFVKLSVKGLINHYNLSRDFIFLDCSSKGYPAQEITTRPHFEALTLNYNTELEGLLNSLNMSTFTQDCLMYSGPQKLTASVKLTGSSDIQDINASNNDQIENLVKLKEDSKLKGHMLFKTSPVMGGNLFVGGLAGDLKFANLSSIFLGDSAENMTRSLALTKGVALGEIRARIPELEKLAQDINDYSINSSHERLFSERDTADHFRILDSARHLVSQYEYFVDRVELNQVIAEVDHFDILNPDVFSAKKGNLDWIYSNQGTDNYQEYEVSSSSLEDRQLTLSQDYYLKINHDAVLHGLETPYGLGKDVQDTSMHGQILVVLRKAGYLDFYELKDPLRNFDSVEVGKSSKSIDVFSFGNETYILVNRQTSLECSNSILLKLSSRGVWEIIQMPPPSLKSTHFAIDNSMYVVLATSDLEIYRRNSDCLENPFKKVFAYPFSGVAHLDVLRIKQDYIIVVGASSTMAKLYQFSGEQGFGEIASLEGSEISEVKLVMSHNRPRLFVLDKKGLSIYNILPQVF